MKNKKIITLFIFMFISINIQAQPECHMESINDPCMILEYHSSDERSNLPDCCTISEPISKNEVSYVDNPFYRLIHLTPHIDKGFINHVQKLPVIPYQLIYAFPLALKTIKFLC